MTRSRQKIFITGASSGIGLATAELFSDRGWQLVLNASNPDRLEVATAPMRKKRGASIELAPFDVRSRPALEAARLGSPSAFEDVDVLVNNAGLARGLDPLQEGRPEDWDEMIDVNIKGLLYVTRAILPGMLRRGRGHVVNLGSTAGHWVYRGSNVYAATKHAVRALNEALRLDVHGSGIRVSSVDPGLAETNFSLVRFRGDAERARKVYEGLQCLTPRDIAETIAWVVDRPAHVNIQEVVLMPTDQASVRDVHRRAP